MMLRFLAAFFLLVFSNGFACAEIKVETVRSNSGVEAWLAHNSTVPIIAVSFSFDGGASQDPDGKEGLARFMAALLDEGAGPYDSRAFQEKLQTLAISLSFSADHDYVAGSLQTLSANREVAFEMLGLALIEPRFDDVAVERIRGQFFALLRSRANENSWQAANAFAEAAYPSHPYGRPIDGKESSLQSVSRNDIILTHKNLISRGNLKIAVAGDISADELSKMLDRVFGSLPEKPELKPVTEAKPQGQGRVIVIQQQGPQSYIQFGGIGPKRHDPDFFASYLLNHMLGGNTFSSRFYNEVREKRGYTYGVSSDILAREHSGAFVGTLSTRNEVAGDALQVIKDEITKFTKDGPANQELAKAKTFIIGSYPLRFDTTAKITNMLLGLLQDNLPATYLREREQLINAVTAKEVREAAQKMFAEPPLVVVVGLPKGIKAK